MTDRLPPYRTFLASDADIREILRMHRTIAMVGIGSDSDDPALKVALALRQRGYRVLPIHPAQPTLLGVRAWPDLASVDEVVGIVDVVSGPDSVPTLSEQAVDIGAAVLWLEPGAVNPKAAYRASSRGLQVIMNREILKEYEMHFPDDELGYPDP